MLSLSHLRPNLFKLFLLANNRGGISVNVHHNKNVYLLTIQPTGERWDKYEWRQAKKEAVRKKAVALPLMDCETCNGIMVGDICLNKHCPTNKGKF